MSKTLETKKKILSLLKNRKMTITELSIELGLTTATVSQHIDELKAEGAIERINNEYYRKLKYYTMANSPLAMVAKFGLGVIALLVIASVLYLQLRTVSLPPNMQHYLNNTPSNNSAQGQVQGQLGNQTGGPQATVNNNITSHSSSTITSGNYSTNNSVAPTPSGAGSSIACVNPYFQRSGAFVGSSNLAVYTLNSNVGNVSDYVITPGVTGTIYAIGSPTRYGPQPQAQTSYPGMSYNVMLTPVNTSMMPGASDAAINVTAVSYSSSKVPTSQPQVIISGGPGGQQITITIATTTLARGTYWVSVGGSYCGTAALTPFLLTAGNSPYGGNVTYRAYAT